MKHSLSFMRLWNNKEMRLNKTLCFPYLVLSFNNSFWIVEIRLQWWYLQILKFCIMNQTLWQAYYLALPFPVEKAPTKEYHGKGRVKIFELWNYPNPLNFSNPLIVRDFDPNSCTWAYGMNIFDFKNGKRRTWQGSIINGKTW